MRPRLSLFLIAGLACQGQVPVQDYSKTIRPTDPPEPRSSQLSPPASLEIQAFLDERRVDLTAARREPFRSVLVKLSQSKDATERLWALTRLLESGDLSFYSACSEAMTLHVRGTAQLNSGQREFKVKPARLVIGRGAPEATFIAPESPFWRALRATLSGDPEAKVDSALYSIWCYNTHPTQRDLIHRIAARIESQRTARNPEFEPWNDPRFWIVTDWAIAWGGFQDFETLQQVIQDPSAKDEFRLRFEKLKKIQSYLPCLVQNTPDPNADTTFKTPTEPSLVKAKNLIALLALNNPWQLDLSQTKALRTPPPPMYPREAMQRRLMGDLEVEITVDTLGEPCMVRLRPGPFLAFFAATCLQAAESWRFEPAKVNNIPVTSRFLLTMPFRLR